MKILLITAFIQLLAIYSYSQNSLVNTNWKGQTDFRFEHPNFSGEWKLNESKSELGDFGSQLAVIKIKIDQYKDSITFTKTHPNEAISTETLSYDGKESVRSVSQGTAKRKSTAKWSEDGQSFIISFFIINSASGQRTITGIQTLSLKEGKLYVETSYSSPQQGDFIVKAVYDKQ
ncbi:MAG TPA: hypothetical protein VFU29_19550 [Chitinophagaceae bacterium]|nr:hypothetical protein [Chitinophagaceae bacterium]